MIESERLRHAVKIAFFIGSLALLLLLDYIYINYEQFAASIVSPILLGFTAIVFSVIAILLCQSDLIAECRYQPVVELLLSFVACSPWLCLSYREGKAIVMAGSQDDPSSAIQSALYELQSWRVALVFVVSTIATAIVKIPPRRDGQSESQVVRSQNTIRTYITLLVGLFATFSLSYSAPLFYLILILEWGLYGRLKNNAIYNKERWLIAAITLTIIIVVYTYGTEGLWVIASMIIFVGLWYALEKIPLIRESFPDRLRIDKLAFTTLALPGLSVMFAAMKIQQTLKLVLVVMASYVLLDGVASPLSEYFAMLLARNGERIGVARDSPNPAHDS